MASKKTTSKKSKNAPVKKAPKAAPKAPKEKKEPKFVGPRHPAGRVKATSQGSKEALAKALAPTLVRGDEDKDGLEAKLKTASNQQLLRLQKVADAVKSKYGSRAGLIEAIGKSEQKGKDKDFIAKLETLSLPNLLDIAKSVERRARA
jgi:hypothetical protein